MTPLEAKLAQFLNDCEGLMEPIVYKSERMVIKDQHNFEIKEFINKPASIAMSYSNADSKIQKLSSLRDLKAAFDRDKVFSSAVYIAGFWGTLKSILQLLIPISGSINKGRISFDYPKAISYLKELRQVFTGKILKVKSTAPLIGLTSTVKIIDLPDGISLRRLTIKERNNRLPIYNPIDRNSFDTHELFENRIELSVPIVVPVDHKKKSSLFEAHNNARNIAFQMFDKVVSALLVSLSGNVKLGPVTIEGGYKVMCSSIIPSYQGPPIGVKTTIRKKDIFNLSASYELVSGGKSSDKTIDRSLHRFLLGRKRRDIIDKLVDYVIAFEALLLTQSGSPITQELSYRFSLNGAALIATANRKSNPYQTFKKLKSAYASRSTIVHGGSDKRAQKSLDDGGFGSTQELCDYLESSYRDVIFWLNAQKVKERPYVKDGGWESLIWQ